MNAIEVPVNGERLMADLKRLREFGACGTGVVRTSLSPVDVESRHWLRGQLEDADLDARIDGGGQRHRPVPPPREGGAHRLPHRYAADRRLARRSVGRDLRAGGRAGAGRVAGDEGPCGGRRLLARRGGPVLRLLRQPLVRGRDAGARARFARFDRRHRPDPAGCAARGRARRPRAGAGW